MYSEYNSGIDTDNNNGFQPKKRRRGCTCLVVAFVFFLIIVLGGAAAGWFIGDSFTRNNLDIGMADILAISADLRRSHSPDGFNDFSDADRAAFTNHILEQLFLNPSVSLPYNELFDSLLGFFTGSGDNYDNDGGFLPFNESADNLDDNSLLAIFSSLLVKENINTTALSDFDPREPHNFSLTDRQLASFVNEILTRGLQATRPDTAPEYGLDIFELLDEVSLRQIRFVGSITAPYMQVTIRTGLRQITRTALGQIEAIPNFLTNFLTWALLPQTVYINAFVGLTEENAGLTIRVNDLTETQMLRLYRLIDGFIDYITTGMNVENRTAYPYFTPSDLATTINSDASYLLSPIMASLEQYLIFDNISYGRVSADLFGTLISLSGINNDEYGNLRSDYLSASDFIQSLRFFVLSEAGYLELPASANYNAVITEFADKLFLTDYGRYNFNALLGATDMSNFDPHQFNIRGNANSIAHDTRNASELYIFIQDADFGAILRDRFLANLDVEIADYLELAALSSIPYIADFDPYSLQKGQILHSSYGELRVTFRIDIADLLYGFNIPFIASLVIDALYIDLIFNISEEGRRFELDEEQGFAYYYYYSASIFVNNLPLENEDIQSILRIGEFFSGLSLNVEEITRAAGRELFRFFRDMNDSWFSQNINFGFLSLGNGKYQTGIVIASIFHLLAGVNTEANLDAQTLQSAIQGMFSYNSEFGNSRNFNRDYLIVNPIQGDLTTIMMSVAFGDGVLADYEMGYFLNSPFIANTFGSNPFVSSDNSFSLSQFNSVATSPTTARLYFTFNLNVAASDYLIAGGGKGLGAFIPDYLYFTFVLEWNYYDHDCGNRYKAVNYDYTRAFKINNLSFEQQRQLFNFTDYDYSYLITGPINRSLAFLNYGHLNILYGNGVVTVSM